MLDSRVLDEDELEDLLDAKGGASSNNNQLNGAQRKYLRGLAHSLKALVLVGKRGLTGSLIAEVDHALDAHELVKVKFVDHKDERVAIAEAIETGTASTLVGRLGNTAIFYRPHKVKKKRKIEI